MASLTTSPIANRAPATATYNLGPVQRIPEGEGREFLVGRLRVAVFRPRGGGLFATQARCPHSGGPLADGLVGDRKVICPLHAYRFDLATGQPLGQQCGALKTYPVSLSEEGEVLVSLEQRQLEQEEDPQS